jgi:indolepyruvate ferredoxin oxidoreductase beta subunit|uniref:Indolepyruvate oxidoreductase subunit beta n=1 Tax=candidate division WOR-3 bacterium TaxID=2052148 RepID=A0A7V5XZK1_UNCW3
MNIVVCGIGGQGVLLFSDILGEVAMLAGYDVKKSEVKGMAQRGGSVVSHLRFDKKVYSPLIPLKTADFIVGMEKLETVRYLDYLKEDGIVITDEIVIPPLPILVGEENFDFSVLDVYLKERVKKLYYLPAQKIAEELGNVRVSNMVLMGFLSAFLPFEVDDYFKVIKRNVKEDYFKINQSAFLKGREEYYVRSYRHQ